VKNSKIYLTLLLGGLIAIISCNKKADEINPTAPNTPETPATEVKKPGQFGLTQMATNQRISKQVINGITYIPSEAIQETDRNQRTTNNVSFDLGNLKASKSFYFILSNTGDTSLTNITIESNNENFEVFPKSIEKLAPAGQDGVVPLLELGIIHGNRLNGLGFQSLLAMGDNTVEVTIKGKTFGENGEEDVTLKAQVKLFAEVMDIEVYINDQIQPYRDAVGNYLNVGDLNENQVFKIKNTGNVDINLQNQVFTQEQIMIPSIDTSFVLPVGQTAEFPSMMQTLSTTYAVGRIFMDGNGAAVNPDHLVTSNLKPGFYGIHYNYRNGF